MTFFMAAMNRPTYFDSVRNFEHWDKGGQKSEITQYKRFGALMDIIIENRQVFIASKSKDDNQSPQ